MSITIGTPVNSGNLANASSRTQGHTTNANSKCLVVIVTGYDSSATDSAVSSVTFNNISLSFARYYRSGSGFIAIYYLSKPTVSQTANVVVTMGGTCTDLQVTSVDLVSATASSILFDTYNESTLSTTGHSIVINPAIANSMAIGGIVALVSAITALSVTAGTEISGSEADMGSQCAGCATALASGTTVTITWTKTSAVASYALICTFYEQFAPTTALNSPADVATGQSTTPVLKFTGTETNSNNLEYHIEITRGISAWTEQQPAGNTNKNWQCCSIDFDGTNVRMLVGVYGGRLYYYNGTSWVEQTPAGSVDKDWQCCSLAFDGTNVRMIAGVYSGRLYYYNGTSWVEQTPAGDVNTTWYCSSIVFDGTNLRMLAGVFSGRLWYYNGSSWAEERPAGDIYKNWNSCSLAFDGPNLRMIAGVYTGRLYYYNGSSWAEQQPAGNVDKNWLSCSISIYGTNVRMLAGANGRLYYHNGTIWAEQTEVATEDKIWYGASIVFDGTNVRMFAVAYTNRAYYYNGSSWADIMPTGDTNEPWYCCALAFDGTTSKLLAGIYNGRLYSLSQSNSISKFSSVPDTGFLDSPNEGDTHPFTSATEVQYTVQASDALQDSVTYYWRVRAIAPAGSNTWGNWSSTKSFTVQATNISTLSLGRAWMIIYGTILLISLGSAFFQQSFPKQHPIEEAEYEILN